MPNVTFIRGQTIRAESDWLVAGVLTDPTNLTLTVTDPSGNATTYTYGIAGITRTALGKYYSDVLLNALGEWQFTWAGTGAAAGTITVYYDVVDATSGTELVTIRQMVGKALKECITGTVTSATTTTLIDLALLDGVESRSAVEGAWVKIVSGAQAGTVRRVSGYAPGSGEITVSRAWDAAPEADCDYELHMALPPGEIDRIVNETLPKLSYLTTATITPVDSQRQYSLDSILGLHLPEQVVDVLWRAGDTANQYTHTSLPWYSVRPGLGANELTLECDPRGAVGTGDAFVVQYWRYYDPLPADTAATTCPAEWVVAGAAMQVLLWLSQPGPAEDTKRYKDQTGEAAKTFYALCRKWTPRFNRRVQHDEPRTVAYERNPVM